MNDRLDRIRAALAEEGLDALLVSSAVEDSFGTHSVNRRYVSGFTGSTGYVLVTRDGAHIAVDFRYVEQAERECVPAGFEVHRFKDRFTKWFPEFLKQAGMGGKKVGVSGGDLSARALDTMQKAVLELPWGLRPELGLASPILEKLRRHKGPEEVAAIVRAVEVADLAFADVAAALREGMTELEVAAAVEAGVKRHGAQGVSFETIVAGGPWSAMPHASPRAEPVRAGQPIVVDMGARVDGYCSDLSRTVTVGPGDATFREVYEIVFAAQRNAIERVEAGMTGAQAHELAQSVIDARGHGEHFGHGLGHGIGLEVHEDPYLGKTSEFTLEEGNIFTIEPGIYLPGWGGVRIEDIVVLENGRARVLSRAPKLVPGD